MATLTENYLSIPRRLIIELRDNPLAIALYIFVARLYLIVQSPVPLSRGDIQKFDPSTKPGAIKRAFDRLVAAGWLIETAGSKNCYTPTWGKQRGTDIPYPWKIGVNGLGGNRRTQIEAVRVDRALLDLFLGRFRPHARKPWLESYFSRPLIRLLDVGTYILLAEGLPADDTRQLEQWGLVCDGRVQPIPDDAVVVALASQRARIDTFHLTELGWRKLGWGASAQEQTQHQKIEAAPLIFVPKALIGSLIGSLIGESIGCSTSEEGHFSAPVSAKTQLEATTPTITGTHGDSWDSRESPPTPHTF